ncbi:MAG: lipid-A-disaccharide synthase [Deltaproteobacteria bacterium]|nr:lipid-A-disaccharide synthase [Deltaproteobacteria bacterium]
MEIFVSAGEASSDIHCALLIRELRKLGGDFTTFGLGGDKLKAEGTKLLMHNHEFSAGGGPLEVVALLPRRHRLERMLEERLFNGKPVYGAILCDNGEINLRLASLLHFFNVPIVYFIPPKVWVWRHSRIEAIEQHVDLVLSILPFEEPIYRHWEIPFKYVGNPLIDEVDTSMTEQQAKQRLGIAVDKNVLTVFAGSRYNEVKYHAALFGAGIRKFVEALPAGESKPLILLPAAPAIDAEMLKAVFAAELSSVGCEVQVVKEKSHECLRAARAALVKSGTSTLEAALLGTPMILAYHSSKSSEWLYRHVVRYRGFVGLVNLFLADSPEAALGWEPGSNLKPVVPELILEKCTPSNIATELTSIYFDTPARQAMLRQLARTRSLLLPKGAISPLLAAAQATHELFARSPDV